MRVVFEARDQQRHPTGIINGVAAATVVARFNAVGSYSLKIPLRALSAPVAGSLVKGCGIRVWDDDTGQQILSGPITAAENTWGESDPWGGTRTVTGVSDLIHVADRITWPNPARAWTAQDVDAYWIASGAAETVIRGLISANAGPAAIVERRVPQLTLTADGARGGTTKVRSRFENLLDACSSAALRGGQNLMFDIVANDAGLLQLLFRVPVNAPVLFTRDAGTVRSGKASTAAPTVTRALVAGQGQGTARATREVGDGDAETAWGRRVEKLVDQRQTSDADELVQAGQEAVADGAETNLYSVTAQESRFARFLVDYRVGDRVAYEAVDGVELSDVVREVRIQLDGDGTNVTPTIGPSDASTTPTVRGRVERIERALRKLHTEP